MDIESDMRALISHAVEAAATNRPDLGDYLRKNQIFDHPELGFCKLGDVTFDKTTATMSVSFIPLRLVYEFTINEKTGEVTVLKGDEP